MAPEVIIYSSDYCGFCFRARSLLASKQANITEHCVDGDRDLREKMMRKSGQRTVPQIWIGNQHIGGCDDLYQLEQSGKLDLLLYIDK
ncbi:MAG: glutaredoxin 3 [Gammaproteobacteria bacterium]|nr:glutaredoxin 3 [Gammaproteobacteria bacterium]